MLVFGVVSLLAAVGVAVATGGRDVRERLSGYEEVPTLSSPASGEFKARVNRFSGSIEWRLSYRGFTTDVTQAHIHFGARAINGGISVWLCQTGQANAPAGTAVCPLREGTISGVIVGLGLPHSQTLMPPEVARAPKWMCACVTSLSNPRYESR